MHMGVVCFLAIASSSTEDAEVLGFSSDTVEGDMHRTALYVRRSAARHGVGRTLFGEAERAAREAGAPMLTIEAALGAVPFWIAMGSSPLARATT